MVGTHDLSVDPFATRMDDPGYAGKSWSETRAGRRNSYTLYMMSVALPFAIVFTLLFLFSFVYHLAPALPWFVAFIAAEVAVFGCWPPQNPLGRTRWDWAPMIVNLLAVFFGVTAGLENYTQISPMVHINYLHHYGGVRPSANPDAYVDAGVLGFARDARLDATQSAGYFSWPHRYCVAPIVSDNPEETVSFWAAGMNCCDARGRFWCGDADDDDTHGGAGSTAKMIGIRIMPSLNIGRWIWHGHEADKLYNLAVGMAAGSYGLKIPRNPIVVGWVKDVDHEAWVATFTAVIFFAVFVLITLVLLVMFGQRLVNAKDGRR